MKCNYEKCSNEASVELFLSSSEDKRSLTSPGHYYCDEHAAEIRKTNVVSKEEKFPDVGSKHIVGSAAKQTSRFKNTLQDLKNENSSE